MARRDVSGAIRYFFSDHLGTARVMTSFGGVAQQESTYYPFGGEQRVITNIVDNRYKFAGMYRDATTGLDHTLFRNYSQQFGRWYSPDPLWVNLDRIPRTYLLESWGGVLVPIDQGSI